MLEYIIHPITISDFWKVYFEKKVLYISRSANYYDKILTISDIQDYLNRIDINEHHIELTLKGKIKNLSTHKNRRKVKTNLPNVLSHFTNEKYTIILNQLYAHVNKLSYFINELNKQYPFDIGCNVYITPPNSQGFNAHIDYHDVFILQIEGKKTWYLYEQNVELPFKRDMFKIKQDDSELPNQTIELKAGDLLYLPRGFKHKAETTDEASAHITLGIYSPLTGKRIVDELSEVTISDLFFRKSVFHLNKNEMVNYEASFKEKLHEIIEDVDIKALIKQINEKEYTTLNGHTATASIKDIFNASKINLTTTLRKHNNFKTLSTQDNTFIYIGKNKDAFPLFLKPIVDFVLNSEKLFTGEDLQSITKMKDKDILKLIRKLLSIGLITLVD